MPEWRRLFGSGSRCAVAISNLSPSTELHTYAFGGWAEDVRQSMSAHGIKPHVTEISEEIAFSYFHSLSQPKIRPLKVTQQPPLDVTGDVVTRFGFLEGDAIVHARVAIYDPQTAGPYRGFRENGSTAEHLCVILNEYELRFGTGERELQQAVSVLHQVDDAEVVVVKRGVSGALVFIGDSEPTSVPPYRSEEVFKIGTGDIFTAAFGHYWADKNLDPVAAADHASRCVAHYAATRDTLLPPEEHLIHGQPAFGPFGRIYLAGPFFDLARRWMVEEALDRLLTLGAEVFSPLHEVGTGRPDSEIANDDLDGLRSCSAVLALLDGEDPGTLFEIGYARSIGLPVIAFAQNVRPGDLTMISGSGCVVIKDFTTALYHAIWASTR